VNAPSVTPPSVTPPSVTIEHRLPGRLRLRLSHPLRQPERVERMVAEHAGVAAVRYTAVSRSVLVHFDPRQIASEEIILRIAAGLSLERANADVRVLTRPPIRELTDSAFWSGLALLAAAAARFTTRFAASTTLLDRIAGIATAGAVLNHGWVDYRRRGNIDPEVLTLTYLLTALVRTNPLPAAIVTWVSAFGRHLVRLPPRGIIVHPEWTGRQRLQVQVAPDPTPPDKMSFLSFVPTMLLQSFAGTPPGEPASLIGEIRRVAKVHDQVLEGVSGFRRGIHIRIREAATNFVEE
jgi:hypothetical protein